MLFGSDYAIWEPKWQVEGFADWEMPDDREYDDYPRLGVEGKKKILGLNAAKLYGVEVPEELRLPVPADEPASRRARSESRVSLRSRVLEALGTVYDPELDEPITDARLRRLLRRDSRDGRRVGAAAAADAAVRAELRVPDGGRRARRRRARRRRRAPSSVVLEDHYTGEEINAAVGRGDGLRRRVPRRDRRGPATRCARCSSARRSWRARAAAGHVGDRRRDARPALRAGRGALPRAAPRARDGRGRRRPRVRHGATGRRSVPTSCRASGGWRADRAVARDQRRHLPRSAAGPLRGGGGGMKAARLHAYHEALKVEEVDEPKLTRAARRDREDRGGRAVPHRPAHPGGPVGGEVPGRPAVHAGPRERGLGARGRLRRHQRRGRRHGDRAPVHLVRAVPAVPARATTCTASTARSPASTATAASPSSCSRQRALGGQARPVAGAGVDRRARRRGPDRDPRGQEGDPGPRRRARGRS